MVELPDTTPVIIGVGQFAERPDDDGYQALSPMDLGGEALKKAIADCDATGDVATAIDTIAAIRQFEISTPIAQAPFGKSDNPPRSYGKRVGADPDRAILEIVGGQGNQKLVGELGQDIAEGRSELAAIVGSEAISTALIMMGQDETPDWSEEIGGQLEDRGYGMSGLIDRTLIAHGLTDPISNYALFENARRHAQGMDLEAYRHAIGTLFAPFTEIAAQNPYAAAPTVRSADELATVTERNRIVAEPYTRMTVARDQVNQAAAILIASVGKARALGVPEEQWIYIHGVTDAKECSVLERPDMATSPASIASVQDALTLAGMDMGAMDYLDLYSCFAIPVFNILDAFAMAADDPRGLTLTGGLPFFGGAGNNYSAHAIAEAVVKLRSDPEAFALIGANGGFMSKYATGIYSRTPANWAGEARWQTVSEGTDRVEVIDSFTGTATVETYTLAPRKRSTLGAVIARTPAGERFVAIVAADDMATMAELQKGEPFGRQIAVSTDDKGRNSFTFAN